MAVNPLNPQHRFDPFVLLDQLSGRTYIDPARTIPRPQQGDIGLGLVVRTNGDGSPRLEWSSVISDNVVVGLVRTPATEPHEHEWATLDTLVGSLRAGNYLIVASNPPAQLPVGVPAGTSVSVGDWLVAVDRDGDSIPDGWHVVPIVTGGTEVTVYGIPGADGGFTNGIATTPDQAGIVGSKGHMAFNDEARLVFVHDGTAWRGVFPTNTVRREQMLGISAGNQLVFVQDKFVHMIVDPADWLGVSSCGQPRCTPKTFLTGRGRRLRRRTVSRSPVRQRSVFLTAGIRSGRCSGNGSTGRSSPTGRVCPRCRV